MQCIFVKVERIKPTVVETVIKKDSKIISKLYLGIFHNFNTKYNTKALYTPVPLQDLPRENENNLIQHTLTQVH